MWQNARKSPSEVSVAVVHYNKNLKCLKCIYLSSIKYNENLFGCLNCYVQEDRPKLEGAAFPLVVFSE